MVGQVEQRCGGRQRLHHRCQLPELLKDLPYCQLRLAEWCGRCLCAMCAKLACVIGFQVELREERAVWGRGLSGNPALVVVWVGFTEAGPTASAGGPCSCRRRWGPGPRRSARAVRRAAR